MYYNEDKILSLLGLAARARKIQTGDSLMKSIRQGKAELVLISEDASDNTKKKFEDKCSYYQVPCYIFSNINSLSKAIGKDNRVCVGICDRGFAIKIKSILGGWDYGKKE